MKKNLLFALIVLCIAIAFAGCQRCGMPADNELRMDWNDSAQQSFTVLNKYDIGFTKLVTSDTFRESPLNKELDFKHDWEILRSTRKDTIRITELKYKKKYQFWGNGGGVDDYVMI